MPNSDRRPVLTPYQLTLSAMIVPMPRRMLMNAAIGVAFCFVAGPYPALLWVAVLSTCDAVQDKVYRRLEARSAEVPSHVGLARVAWIGLSKALAWVSGPALFTVMTRSPLGMAFVGVICIALTALAVSSVRNSRRMFLSASLPLIASLAVCVVVVIGAEAGAGLLFGLGVVVVALFQIANGTNRTVTEWNRANEQTFQAMATLETALERSRAVERRFEIAIEIAHTYVFEVDYVRRTFTGTGAEREFFDHAYGGDAFWTDPFRNVVPEDRPIVEAGWADHLAGRAPYRIEHRVVGPDGRQMWITASAELTRDKRGRPIAMIGALRDITERKLSKLKVAKALEEAEAASQAKSEFLTAMSHETRTPLNGVLGMVQAMERDELSAAQRARLDVLRSSGQALLVLLNSVFDLDAMKTGKLVFEDGEVDIAGVAEAAVQVFESAAADKGLGLSLTISPEAEGVYAGDPVRVAQVLHCLISNAVKFTEAGSVGLTIDRRDEALVFRVADTGIGISAEQMPGLLENFFQADASLTRRHGGIGLGLAICRQLTVRMGGALNAESIEGLGSIFTVTLPLPRLRDSGERPAKLSMEEASDDQHPLRVLVAEDHAVNQLVLRTMLQQLGVEPTMVANGGQALSAWRNGEWDLVLMDIQMPVMDGISATQAIRGEELRSGRVRTPILAVTANLLPHQVETYHAAGIDDVVAKPVQCARLIEAMESALAASEPPEADVAA